MRNVLTPPKATDILQFFEQHSSTLFTFVVISGAASLKKHAFAGQAFFLSKYVTDLQRKGYHFLALFVFFGEHHRTGFYMLLAVVFVYLYHDGP